MQDSEKSWFDSGLLQSSFFYLITAVINFLGTTLASFVKRSGQLYFLWTEEKKNIEVIEFFGAAEKFCFIFLCDIPSIEDPRCDQQASLAGG